jgi:hypothetical protein
VPDGTLDPGPALTEPGSLTTDRARVKVIIIGNQPTRRGEETVRMPEMSEDAADPEGGAADPEGGAAPLRSGPLVLSDVYLLTAESDGNVAVPGLTVMLDGSGLTVRKPDGAIAAVVPWAEVSGLTASRRIRTPAGSHGVIVEAVTSFRTHRFVVPSANPDGLEYEIGQLAAAMVSGGKSAGPGTRSGRKRRSRVFVGALVVVIVAGIALAVLVATGTVKF